MPNTSLHFKPFGDYLNQLRLSALAVACVVMLNCFQPVRTPEQVEIPKGYVGWIRVNFDDSTVPPLPTRDGVRIMRIPESGALATSSHFEEGWAVDRYFYYSSEGLSELHVTGWGEGGMIWGGHSGTGTGERGRYHACFFVGTEADLNSAEAQSDRDAKGKFPVPDEPTPGSMRPLAQ